MKKSLFFLLQVSIATMLVSCNSFDKEKNSISHQQSKAQIKKEAQDWFVKQSSSLRNSSSQVLYDNPSWRFTAVNQKGGKVAVDVDLTDVAHYDILTEESFSCLKQNPDEWKYYRSQMRMVILSDTTLKEQKDGFLMVFLPSKEYIDDRYEYLQSNTYFHMDPLYDGRVLYFELDGTPLYGHKYEKGKIVSQMTPVSTNERTGMDTQIFSTIGLKASYTVISQKLRARTHDDDYVWDCGELEEVTVVGKRRQPGETLSEWMERYNRHINEVISYDWHDSESIGMPLGIGGKGFNKGEWDKNNNQNLDKDKLEDPCENMKSKSSNKYFMKELDSLASRASKEEYELGRTFTYDEKKREFKFEEHNGGRDSINLNHLLKERRKIDGFIHTHNVNQGHWEIFTGEDLLAMYNMYELELMRDPETFTMGLVTSKGCYFLKIANISSFKQYFSSINGNLIMLNDMIRNFVLTKDDIAGAFASFINNKNGNSNTTTGLILFERKEESFVEKSVNKATGQVEDKTC